MLFNVGNIPRFVISAIFKERKLDHYRYPEDLREILIQALLIIFNNTSPSPIIADNDFTAGEILTRWKQKKRFAFCSFLFHQE